MAFFTNSASLTYGGRRIQSNTVTGEIRETVSMTKTAVTEEYTSDDSVSFVITLVNSGTEAVSGLTLTDDLGAYPMEAETLYPLAYTEGSLRSFLDGVPQSAPTVSAGPARQPARNQLSRTTQPLLALSVLVARRLARPAPGSTAQAQCNPRVLLRGQGH